MLSVFFHFSSDFSHFTRFFSRRHQSMRDSSWKLFWHWKLLESRDRQSDWKPYFFSISALNCSSQFRFYSNDSNAHHKAECKKRRKKLKRNLIALAFTMRLRTSPLAAVVVGQSTLKENATISNVRSSRAKSDSKIDLVLLASEGKARKSFLFLGCLIDWKWSINFSIEWAVQLLLHISCGQKVDSENGNCRWWMWNLDCKLIYWVRYFRLFMKHLMLLLEQMLSEKSSKWK